MNRGTRPLIGVISDRRQLGLHAFHMVGEKYLASLIHGACAYPVALPSLNGDFDVLDIIDRLDGLFLTGSPSNIEPHHYMGDPSKPGTHTAACEIVGVYATNWNIVAVAFEPDGKIDLMDPPAGKVLQLTTNGQSYKESEWIPVKK